MVALTNTVYLNREIICDINSEKSLSFKSNVKYFDGTVNKAIILGYKIKKLAENIYALIRDNDIQIISDKQICLPVDSSELFERTHFKEINFNSIDTSKVKNMKGMFWNCESDSIDLSSFNTSNVKNMGGMFYNCKAKILDLTSFDTSNVEDMGAMFWFCEAESIDLSSFDTSNVEDMYNMFYECKAESLDLRNFNTCQVKDMQYMFCNCRADYIDLSSFDTSKVENTQYMFVGCKAGLAIKDKRLLKKFNNYIKIPFWNNKCQ